MAALSLPCYWRAFSSFGEQGPLFSLQLLLWLWSTDSCGLGLSSCGSWAQLPHGMWNPPWPGIQPSSPASAGGFLTTGPSGKSSFFLFDKALQVLVSSTLSYPAVSCWALPLPSHFELSERLQFFNFMLYHTSETLYVLVIFLECLPPVVYLVDFSFFKIWPSPHYLQKAFLTLPPSLVFALRHSCSATLLTLPQFLFFFFLSYLSPLLGCDSLRSRLHFIFLVYTAHSGKKKKKLAPSK